MTGPLHRRRQHLKRGVSEITVVTPSTIEKAESMPRLTSVKKNSTPIRFDTPLGKLETPCLMQHNRGHVRHPMHWVHIGNRDA